LRAKSFISILTDLFNSDSRIVMEQHSCRHFDGKFYFDITLGAAREEKTKPKRTKKKQKKIKRVKAF